MSAPEQRPVSGREALRVLIVEDSEDDALLVIDALRSGGFDLFSKRVATAEEMRGALGGSHWDLIISDFRVPGFGALEAFAIYREYELDLPFLIVSGVIGEETAVAAMKTGAHDCVSKNNLARLAPAVRRELRDAESRGERVRAEAALRSAYAELAAIQAQAPVLMLVVDENLRVCQANELAMRFAGSGGESLVGVKPGEAIRCLNSLADPRGCGYSPECATCSFRLAILDTLRTGTRHDNVEKWVPTSLEDGQNLRCLLLSSALMGTDPPKRTLICAADVTELKQAQVELERNHERLLVLNRDLDRKLEELRSALSEKEVLFKEVQHRVKNNLQVISSLLSLQAENVASDAARSILAECRDRVRSMALIHEQLSYSGKMAQVEFAQYIERLAAYLLDSYGAGPEQIRFTAGVAATLTLDQAVPCGLIVQELFSNSLKHAFPGDSRGEIRIEFRRKDGAYHLAYRDNGIGLPPAFDVNQSRSLGMQLVSDLTAQLRGELTYFNSGGAHFNLSFPAREP